MRQKIIAGNWKMNQTLEITHDFITELSEKINQKEKSKQIIIAPPYPFLERAVHWSKGKGIDIAAQNMHQCDKGAYTGEVSADMLYSTGVNAVILGHSERREHFGENDEILMQKVVQALENNLQVIFCTGESFEQRKTGKHFETVQTQIEKALFALQAHEIEKIVLAYEPIWAIGTGESATSGQAQEMHAYIRGNLSERYGKAGAEKIRILYGGSLKPDNAKEFLFQKDIDGGLIGGASLKVVDFLKIIESC
ncbi:triose-phosphate isomerase [Bacteroidetes bacterium endosymbiont of Geopemphigus sp.]|uniref:triose-phosphate isomerase n=1 Tax=Bacteroidetes bacterium endosymbiont of Geopemphigus sp. TaxID=2047937 RepID=UPI000CD2174E|nr:triose-phosphate isomerase [Bacteroidetes bacterium endosymbiont of Geopemphigus sp.]